MESLSCASISAVKRTEMVAKESCSIGFVSGCSGERFSIDCSRGYGCDSGDGGDGESESDEVDVDDGIVDDEMMLFMMMMLFMIMLTMSLILIK